MNPAQRLVSALLIIMLTAGCVSSGAPMTPADAPETRTTTKSAVGVQVAAETNTTTTTQTATQTATNTTTTTQTATATQTPTPTPTTTSTTTMTATTTPPARPPANVTHEVYRTDVGTVDEAIHIEITATNPNDYDISVTLGASATTDDGKRIAIGGESQVVHAGETWTKTFTYDGNDVDNIANDNVKAANQPRRTPDSHTPHS